MTDSVPISDLVFTSSRPRERTRGCLGWIRFTVAGVLRVDGVAVRRASDGRLTLSFPSRRDQGGNRHAVLAPVDATSRRTLEEALIPSLTQLLPQEDVR